MFESVVKNRRMLKLYIFKYLYIYHLEMDNFLGLNVSIIY